LRCRRMPGPAALIPGSSRPALPDPWRILHYSASTTVPRISSGAFPRRPGDPVRVPAEPVPNRRGSPLSRPARSPVEASSGVSLPSNLHPWYPSQVGCASSPELIARGDPLHLSSALHVVFSSADLIRFWPKPVAGIPSRHRSEQINPTCVSVLR